jgi:Cu+-exporting ATPase
VTFYIQRQASIPPPLFDLLLENHPPLAMADPEEPNPPDSVVGKFRIEGMTCSTCSGAVESALAAMPGVKRALVSLTLSEAKVEFDPGLTDETALLRVIEDSGFEAAALGCGGADTVTLDVGGMSCATCAAAVESTLLQVDGIIEAAVNAVSGRAEVKFDPDRVGPRSMVAALTAAGYEARPADPSAGADGTLMREKEKRFWRRKFLIALAFSIPLFIINMILMYITPIQVSRWLLHPPLLLIFVSPGTHTASNHVQENLEQTSGGFAIGSIVSFALATPVQFWVGATFYKGAYRALRRGRPNMDVLVAVGTTAAYAYSIISIAWQRAHEEFMVSLIFNKISRYIVPMLISAFFPPGPQFLRDKCPFDHVYLFRKVPRSSGQGQDVPGAPASPTARSDNRRAVHFWP